MILYVQKNREGVMHELMKILFANSKDWIRRITAELAKQNMDRMGQKEPAQFMFRRRRFSPVLGQCRTIKLHPSLREEAADLSQVIDALEQEKDDMRNYLGTLLLRCRTRADLKLMLPEMLWNKLPKDMVTAKEDDFVTVSSADVSKFKMMYRGSEELIQRRMVKNLIER